VTGIFEAVSHAPLLGQASAHPEMYENLMPIATSKATTDFTNFTEMIFVKSV
jgi:hypothetical protein